MSGKRYVPPPVESAASKATKAALDALQPAADDQPLADKPAPPPPPKEGAAGETRIRQLAAEETSKVLMGPEVEEHMRTLARQEITRAMVELRRATQATQQTISESTKRLTAVVASETAGLPLDPMWRDRLIKLAEAKGEPPAVFLEELVRRAWVSAGSTGKHKG